MREYEFHNQNTGSTVTVLAKDLFQAERIYNKVYKTECAPIPSIGMEVAALDITKS